MKRFLLSLSFIICNLSFCVAQNPYLPLWEHVPDGEPRVFEDPDNPGHLRAYIIGSHDTHFTQYCGNDIRMWSAPVEDLTKWRDEGPIFSWFVSGQWDTMFAPDLVETIDKATGKKTYWLYPHSRGWQRVPMVCKGDRPNGPFVPVNLTEDGTRCVDGEVIGTAVIGKTGSVEKYKPFKTKVKGAQGVHDLYLCFDKKQGDVRLDWWRFLR